MLHMLPMWLLIPVSILGVGLPIFVLVGGALVSPGDKPNLLKLQVLAALIQPINTALIASAWIWIANHA